MLREEESRARLASAYDGCTNFSDVCGGAVAFASAIEHATERATLEQAAVVCSELVSRSFTSEARTLVLYCLDRVRALIDNDVWKVGGNESDISLGCAPTRYQTPVEA